jgi:hypothetical protein
MPALLKLHRTEVAQSRVQTAVTLEGHPVHDGIHGLLSGAEFLAYRLAVFNRSQKLSVGALFQQLPFLLIDERIPQPCIVAETINWLHKAELFLPRESLELSPFYRYTGSRRSDCWGLSNIFRRQKLRQITIGNPPRRPILRFQLKPDCLHETRGDSLHNSITSCIF